jgi:hypothetical protein
MHAGAAVAERITRAEYARRRGWSRAYVTQLVNAGRVQIDEGGLIDPDDADASLAAGRDPSAATRSLPGEAPPPRPAGGNAGPTYMQARTLREAANAKLAQLDYQERSGQLLDRAATESEAMALGRELRENLLAIPARLAQGLADCSDAAACETLLEHALTEALEALADGR